MFVSIERDSMSLLHLRWLVWLCLEKSVGQDEQRSDFYRAQAIDFETGKA